MRHQNSFRARPVRLDPVRKWIGIWILFVLLFIVSGSKAYEITRKHPASQIAAAEISTKAKPVAFQTIVKGSRSGVRESLQIVAGSQAEWDALWKRHVSIETNPPPSPAIDFNKEIVIGVFLGEKPTGGYDVEIIRAEQSDGALVIHYREKSPRPGGIVIQALTQPFHIVQVVRDDNFRATFRRAS